MPLRRRSILPHVVLAVALTAAACSDPAAPPDPSDPESLLTDAQLATAPDPAEAPVDPAWEQWVRANHHTIRSLTSTRFDDLQFLKGAIGARRIVQLGESGHGVREFNMAKVRLIRFLHEEMGFDVLAFESGLFECWNASRMADTSSASYTMGRCPFGVWHTEEVLELFAYLKETRATSRPLVLAGFDVQVSGGTGMMRRYAPDLLAEVVGRVDPAYAAEVRALDEAFYTYYPIAAGTALVEPARRGEIYAAMDAEHGFTTRYQALADFVDAHAAALAAAYPAAPETPLVVRQTAWSRVQLVEGGKSASFLAASTARDRGMADNIDFLLDRMYPGKKMIVWAHNAHIMHDRTAMRIPNTDFGTYPQSMGAFVAARRRAELYTIGLFMYRGRAANNAGIAYDVEPPLPHSLEATLYRARKQWIFVDLLGQQRSAGTGWMFDRIPIKEWGTNDYSYVPRAQFDGILFVDTVSPPEYYLFPRGTRL